jgi:hypothetical protein
MVAQSWHYGFFFTPFPALLTFFFAGYLTAAAVSVHDLIKPVAWLGEPMPLALRRKNILREVVLLISTQAFVYLAFSNVTQICFDGSSAWVHRAQALISVDRVLFGPKRAESQMLRFADKSVAQGRRDIAAGFLNDYLVSVVEHHRSEETIANAVASVALNNIRIRQGRRDAEMDKGP